MNYFIGHLVGDFLLQNDYVAENKKKSTLICLLHVLLYSGMVWAATSWPWWAMGIVAVTHFIQDRTPIITWYMKLIGQEKFMGPPLGPWSIIVVDQVFHLLTLFIIAKFV